MEFVITLVFLVGLPAILVSGLIVTPLFRMQKPYAKPLAIIAGLILSVVFAWVIFVALILYSLQRGHPF